MTTVIKASGEGSSLFNALAIGLSVELLSGRLDAFQDTPGYQELLNEFEKLHPQFKPKSWNTLKDWLLFYNNARDLELLLAPVLFKQYQQNLDGDILDELTNLVWKYKSSIDSSRSWYELADVGNFCHKLDNLDIGIRTELLIDLKSLLNGQEVGEGRESIITFLKENAQKILTELKDKIQSDKRAFQWRYSTEDLRALTESLSLHLVEGSAQNSLDKGVQVVLENKLQHWSVKLQDRDANELLDRSPQRLKVSPFSDQPVNAPSEAELLSAANESVIFLKRIIDNPGLGNCGFYAFVTALLNVIVEEKSYEKRAMFDQWVQLDPSIADLYDQLPDLYERLLRSELNDRARELLDQLQSSLRVIAYQYQVSELKTNCALYSTNPKPLESNSNFVNFAALYYGDPVDTDSRFNPFADSRPVLMELAKIDRSKVVENHESEVLMPTFLRLLYGDAVDLQAIQYDTELKADSPILVAMNNITKDFFWGTHMDLDYLAKTFNVNLHVLQNNAANYEYTGDLPNQHTVTLWNSNNVHWTTVVTVAKGLKAVDKLSSPEELSDTPKLQDLPKSTPTLDGSGIYGLTALKSTLDPATDKDPGRLQHDELLSEQRQLEELRQIVMNATAAYTKHSESIWFCFFHFHGKTGRNRANQFNLDFSKINDLQNAKETLLSYLGNKSNGNTHPHSYRAMLMHELQNKSTNKNSLSLKDISDHYDEVLSQVVIKESPSDKIPHI